MAEEEEIQYMKQKLYNNFKDAGLLDNLKAQMRYKLLEKLQKKDATKENVNSQNFLGQEANVTLGQTKDGSTSSNVLMARVLVSIFSEYLQYHNYNYSNAVFLPETGFSNQVLTRTEVIEILRLGPILKDNDKRALVYSILDQIQLLADNNGKKMSTSSQTDFDIENMNLEQKLRQLDYEYTQKLDEDFRGQHVSLEDRFAKFKKDYDTRMKAEMQAEISRIREFEIAGIRLEEAEKCRIKMERYREEIDKIYSDKMQKLRERERDTIEKCKQQVQMLESAAYEHRQKVLKEFELQKLREGDWESQLKLEKENLKIQKERMENMEKDLQRQLKEIEYQKETFRKRIDEGKTMSKMELLKEIEDDRTAVMQLKTKLENEVGKLEQYKNKAENFELQCNRLLDENSQMRDELKDLRNLRKNLDTELQKAKDTIEFLKKSTKKDEEHLKVFDKQMKTYSDDIARWKVAADEYQNLAEQRKREQIESNQKFIREIEYYQNEIEKLEKDRDQLKKFANELELRIQELTSVPQIITNEIGIQKDITTIGTLTNQSQMNPSILNNPSQANPSILKKSQISNLTSNNNLQLSVVTGEDPRNRFEELNRELTELRRKRDEEMFSLFYEPNIKTINGNGRDSVGTKNQPTYNTTNTNKAQSSPYFPKEAKKELALGRNAFGFDDKQIPEESKDFSNNSSDIRILERNKDILTKELKNMMKSETNFGGILPDIAMSVKTDESLSLRGNNEKSFDKFLDSYTDKLIENGGKLNSKPNQLFQLNINDNNNNNNNNNKDDEIEKRARKTGSFGISFEEKPTIEKPNLEKPTKDIAKDIFRLDDSPVSIKSPISPIDVANNNKKKTDLTKKPNIIAKTISETKKPNNAGVFSYKDSNSNVNNNALKKDLNAVSNTTNTMANAPKKTTTTNTTVRASNEKPGYKGYGSYDNMNQKPEQQPSSLNLNKLQENKKQEKHISTNFFEDLEVSSKSNKSSLNSGLQKSFDDEQPKPIIFTNKEKDKDISNKKDNIQNRKLNIEDLSDNKSKTITDDGGEVDFDAIEDDDQMFLT